MATLIADLASSASAAASAAGGPAAAEAAPPSAAQPESLLAQHVRALAAAEEQQRRAAAVQQQEAEAIGRYIESLQISEHKKRFLRQHPELLIPAIAQLAARHHQDGLARGLKDDSPELDDHVLRWLHSNWQNAQSVLLAHAQQAAAAPPPVYATPRLNPFVVDSPPLDRAGIIEIVRAYRGDAAAEHAAKILRRATVVPLQAIDRTPVQWRSLPLSTDACVISQTPAGGPAGLADISSGYAPGSGHYPPRAAAFTDLRDDAVRLKWCAGHCIRRCCEGQRKTSNSDEPDH
jgi:hypothetical protein